MSYSALNQYLPTIKTKKAKDVSYDTSKTRPYSQIEYIVIHYTANDGDTDEGNASYFSETGSNKASAGAHIFVDDDSATKSVPLNRIAWAVGGSKYAGTTGGSYYGKATNANTLNIELCDTIKDGQHDISTKTLENAAVITAYYCAKYDIPVTRVIRHWDVTGKNCPAYMVGNNNALWEHFLQRVRFYYDYT